ncbi:MAG: ATP-binding protein [Phycisphaerae bacterium]
MIQQIEQQNVSRIQRLARRLGRIHHINAESSVAEAVSQMEQLEVGCLLVRKKGRLEGIFTERDVIRCLARLSRSPQKVRVEEVMSRQIVSCTMDTSIAKAQLIMAAHGIRHLPVIENGRPVGMISSRDILAGKLHEVNQALAETTEEAARARGAKDQMLSSVSHELRTPLNGILGMTELTLETELTDQQREYLNIVRTSAEELDTVVRTLMDFAQIEAGLQQLQPVGFCPHQLVNTTLTTLAARAEAKGLEFAVQIESLPEQAIGDPGRIAQVLVNIVANAIKFTEQGRVEVHVKQLSETSEGVKLGFAVRDTGIGIHQAKLEEIFEAFAQAEPGDSRRFGGTGLGLTLSARLVAMMEGSITAESQLGVGSTFLFSLTVGLPGKQDAHYNQPGWREQVSEQPVQAEAETLIDPLEEL